jgi:hypothetical protein
MIALRSKFPNTALAPGRNMLEIGAIGKTEANNE